MPISKKPRKKKSQVIKKKTASSRATSSLPAFRTMESTLRGLVGPSANDALGQAQNLIYQAWETSSHSRRMALARRALKVCPHCADAYVLLAVEAAATLDEQRKLYELGVRAGELALGSQGFEEYAGHFWGFLETRPYMRARAGLAQTLWAQGRHKQAADHYWNMLELNPNDNQGLRYVLAGWLLFLKDESRLEHLFQQYGDEASPFMLYTQALAAFQTNGDTEKARTFAEEAWNTNAHIPGALARTKTVKASNMDYYTPGGENEAAFYLDEYAFVWRQTPGAIDWLVNATKNLKPHAAPGAAQLH